MDDKHNTDSAVNFVFVVLIVLFLIYMSIINSMSDEYLMKSEIDEYNLIEIKPTRYGNILILKNKNNETLEISKSGNVNTNDKIYKVKMNLIYYCFNYKSKYIFFMKEDCNPRINYELLE